MTKSSLQIGAAVILLVGMGWGGFQLLKNTAPDTLEEEESVDTAAQETPSSEIGTAPIYISIISHNEDTLSAQYPDFVEDEEEFWRQRDAVIELARMFQEEGVHYNFQSDWNFLLGIQAYDQGTEKTNGKNLLQYLSKDLGVEIDPHSHEHLGYNYADVAYLIESLGVTPTTTVGGFLAAPPEDSKVEYLQAPIEANKVDYTWTPDLMWGGGTGMHQNESALWTSGMWRPAANDDFFTHDPNAVANVGHYYARWEGLEDLLKKQENGELDPNKIYTFSFVVNQKEIDDDTIEELRETIESYKDETEAGLIQWVTLREVFEIWKTIYNEEPNQLNYDGEATSGAQESPLNEGGCGDGVCSTFENKTGNCSADC